MCACVCIRLCFYVLPFYFILFYFLSNFFSTMYRDWIFERNLFARMGWFLLFTGGAGDTLSVQALREEFLRDREMCVVLPLGLCVMM
jgi:hypothetical protein